MKKLFSLFLALLLLFLCGCTKEPIVNPTESNVATFGTTGSTPAVTIPTAALPETTVSDDTDIDYHQEIMSKMHEIPEYNTEPLIEHDPERQVYISLANQDCDFYPDYFFTGLMFWVITREHYDKSKISVKIPSQTSYTVHVEDMTKRAFELDPKQPSGRDGIYGLTQWQGFSLLGANWQQLGQDALYRKIATKLAASYKKGSEEHEGFILAANENTSDYGVTMKRNTKKSQTRNYHNFPATV